MNDLDLVASEQWRPLFAYGFHDPFWSLNSMTLIYTWITLAILFLFLIPIQYALQKKTSILRHLVISAIQYFMDLSEQSIGYFTFKHFSFISTIFWFIFLCNATPIIPWMEEPTKDLNTTLALGIISFLYVQYYAIKEHGFREYMKEYFAPFFVMLPLNVMGKLATVLSLSFRLFGNIFGGSTISHIYFGAMHGSILLESLGILSGMNMIIFIFFGIFEGFLQAYVFTMLTLTYLAIGLHGES